MTMTNISWQMVTKTNIWTDDNDDYYILSEDDDDYHILTDDDDFHIETKDDAYHILKDD